MSNYTIKRLVNPLPALTGSAFSPSDQGALRGLDCAEISNYPWNETGYCPEARAYVGFDGNALHVLMCAKEETVQAKVATFGGAVCVDSCLEFFFMPFPEKDQSYLNIEVNAAGAAHIAVGNGRLGRTVLKSVPEGFNIAASKHEGAWWAVSYCIPNKFLYQVFEGNLGWGSEFNGNFYKCDESIHPHFGTWSMVEAPQPDFHRPECFGRIKIANA